MFRIVRHDEIQPLPNGQLNEFSTKSEGETALETMLVEEEQRILARAPIRNLSPAVRFGWSVKEFTEIVLEPVAD